jgi:hypothetical protein
MNQKDARTGSRDKSVGAINKRRGATDISAPEKEGAAKERAFIASARAV